MSQEFYTCMYCRKYLDTIEIYIIFLSIFQILQSFKHIFLTTSGECNSVYHNMPKVDDQFSAQDKKANTRIKKRSSFCTILFRKFRLVIPDAAPWEEREAVQHPAGR
ncbi:hypothetical protein VNO77_43686 [Canavalia gladiata]|uniref:Uncharacterized protein n=1 Tax=Canavalia gladiata TaxID=3824 RepID=A0AAN9JUJ8_CANGL